MPERSKTARLFGAACVRVTLERAGHDPPKFSLYRETLDDLAVCDAEVRAYLDAHRAEVERSLDAHGGRSGGRG